MYFSLIVISHSLIMVLLSLYGIGSLAKGGLMKNVGLFATNKHFRTASSISNRLKMVDVDQTSKSANIEVIERANRCKSFLDSSPEPFHCVQSVKKQLLSAGFVHLKENTLWNRDSLVKKGGNYFFTRGGSSIVAFTVGGNFLEGNGFKIIGAHTDSPNLKLKPNSKRSAHGTAQLNVDCYGGGLWHTWFDRDLSLAGRVVIREPMTNASAHQTYVHRLLKIDRPVLRIPSLCIHLQSDDERKAFTVNKDEHLAPILCAEVSRVLTGVSSSSASDSTKNDNDSQLSCSNDTSSWRNGQSPQLLALIAAELQCAEEDIADFELSLYDTQPAALSGVQAEFLCSSRLDNLASCFVAVEALVHHVKSGSANDDEDISVVALFDHEEVGSNSVTGAGSTLISDTIERVSQALAAGGVVDAETKALSASRSFILSVDMAHALHPNYAAKHEKQHTPSMNGGVVVKSNANQRYATSGASGFLARELARRGGVPVQAFSVKNSCPCGSTIGPILSAQTGIRAVDLGMPQLAMHSIREMMGCTDLTHAARLFETFLRDFREVDQSVQKD